MSAGKHSTRNASLNDAKERGAGRESQNPQLNPALDPDNTVMAKGATPGAFGKDGHAHRNTDTGPGGGGGGGGTQNVGTRASATGVEAAKE
ncbi:MAG TPA: hypothetical protein VF595_16470 [Tepidisphaeraceae bacterium]|jgi:hypothetical protein